MNGFCPRKTKRHITQEIAEWDEEHDPSDSVAPELEWGFLNDGVDDPDNKMKAPGQVLVK